MLTLILQLPCSRIAPAPHWTCQAWIMGPVSCLARQHWYVHLIRQRRSNDIQRMLFRLCRVLWAWWWFCHWCTSDIERPLSGLGRYGESKHSLIQPSVKHVFPRLFDVSKQILGQAFVHGVNILVSGLSASDSFSNACVSYFLNILIDTTLGAFRLSCVLLNDY